MDPVLARLDPALSIPIALTESQFDLTNSSPLYEMACSTRAPPQTVCGASFPDGALWRAGAGV